MFIIDKDMERVMLAKKKEVLHEIETAKKRVLKELYCLKRSIHTDMCEMIADYNRIQFNINKLTEDCKVEVKSAIDRYLTILADTIEQYNIDINAKLEFLNQREKEITEEVNSKLSELEDLNNTVKEATDKLNELIESTRTTIDELIANAPTEESVGEIVKANLVNADWNENDETSKAHILNRPMYMTLEQEGMNLGISFSYREEVGSCGGLINYSKTVEELMNMRWRTVIQDSNKNTIAEYPIIVPYVDTDGYITVVKFEDEGVYCRMWLENTRLQGEYYNTKYPDATRMEYSASSQKAIRPDPQLLGQGPTVEQYLRLDATGALKWDANIYTFSPNGTKYKLTVSDDGTLSATAVTE